MTEIVIDWEKEERGYGFSKEDVVKYLKKMEESISNPRAYFIDIRSIANSSFIAGMHAYLLDRPEEANKYFHLSIEYYLKGETNPNDSSLRYDYWKFLECLIFSQDKKIRPMCISHLQKNVYYNKSDDVYSDDPRQFETITIYHLLKNEMEQVKELIPKLKDVELKITKSREWTGGIKYTGRYKMIEGIIENKKELFIEGCVAGIRKFHFNGGDLYAMCSDVLKYFFLADEFGLKIEKTDIPKHWYPYVFRYFEHS